MIYELTVKPTFEIYIFFCQVVNTFGIFKQRLDDIRPKIVFVLKKKHYFLHDVEKRKLNHLFSWGYEICINKEFVNFYTEKVRKVYFTSKKIGKSAFQIILV